MEPQYAFSIPSSDDTALDCRIYHPKNLTLGSPSSDGIESACKGAILAHPYAPLGGSYDDHVVLALTETLLAQNYVVFTFNFRGAGDSAGRTSWTGKGELEDYVSFAGFAIYYLHGLRSESSLVSFPGGSQQTVGLLLGGYSYGSLILARLPPTGDIVDRFEKAGTGTATAEIVLRARTLAKQTIKTLLEQETPASPRGRSSNARQPPSSPSKHSSSPMTVGGEETDPAERRRSRDPRRSVDIIRKGAEVPRRITARVKHRHLSDDKTTTPVRPSITSAPNSATTEHGAPRVSTNYLFVSPVLLPFTSILLHPGAPTAGLSFGKGPTASPQQYLQRSTLAVFGSNDAFTASKRLRQWAEKQADAAGADFAWSEIDGAGHFWGEPGALKALQRRVVEWIETSTRVHNHRSDHSG